MIDAKPARRYGGGRQQPLREPNPSVSHGAPGVAVRGQRTRGQTRRCGHEPGAVGQAQRTRSLGLPQRCADATANSTQQQPRRTVASPLASSLLSELHGSAAVVKGGAASRLRPERFTSLDYHAASLSRNAIVLIAIHSRRPKNSLQFAQALRHPNECHVFGRLRPLAEFCQFASGSVE